MKQLFFFFVILLVSSCSKDDELDPGMEITNPEEYILHISHTRSDMDGFVHDILKPINFNEYGVLCLGGDLDFNTSGSDLTMDIWNDIFPFEASSTLWAIGNHDQASRERISDYTNRPTFYSYTKNNITFLVFDTQLNASNIIGEQLTLFQSVTDTISESTSLILLTHKLIWMPGNSELESKIDDIANGPPGTCDYCTQENNFYDAIYPGLVNVKNKGIQILCIAGDLGFNTQEFVHTTDDDITFLASGIDPDASQVKALLLKHNTNLEELEWRYEVLENL